MYSTHTVVYIQERLLAVGVSRKKKKNAKPRSSRSLFDVVEHNSPSFKVGRVSVCGYGLDERCVLGDLEVARDTVVNRLHVHVHYFLRVCKTMGVVTSYICLIETIRGTDALHSVSGR